MEPKPEEASGPAETTVRVEPTKERTPRLDWAGLLRRTFALDVFACVRCGGRRRVLAYVNMGAPNREELFARYAEVERMLPFGFI